MSKLKRKKISFVARLRNYFITGIVVLVPIGITLYLTTFFISISSKLIPQGINPNSYLPFAIPGLEILLSVIFITLIGGLSLSFIGKKVLQLFNITFSVCYKRIYYKYLFISLFLSIIYLIFKLFNYFNAPPILFYNYLSTHFNLACVVLLGTLVTWLLLFPAYWFTRFTRLTGLPAAYLV